MDYDRRCDDLASAGQSGPDVSGKGNIRKLSQRLIAAAHYACDLGELDMAGTLLALAEEAILRRSEFQSFNKRRVVEDIVSAYERLWRLRQDGPCALPAVESFNSIKDMLGRSSSEL